MSEPPFRYQDFNSSLCLNISGNVDSKLYKACCNSEVTPLELYSDRSIGDGKYLPIPNTDQSMSFPSTGSALQAYSAKNTPCNHWWSLTLSTEFIFYTLFKYKWYHLFLIDLWFPLTTTCTRISKDSWKVLLDIPEKSPSASTTIIFGRSNETKKFPKPHRVTWYDVIYFSPLAGPIPNHVIKYRRVRILRDPYRYGMSPGSQKSRNITSNELYDSSVWSICCAS